MLENTRRYFEQMSEDVKILNVGNFDKFAFPIIRALFPQLAAVDLVSVQPMQGPTTLVFFLDYLYASTKATSVTGTRMYENVNRFYAGEEISGEQWATGDGATALRTGTLTWLPIRPGSLTVTAATITGTDDGNGLITGTGITSGTINYATGAIAVTFTVAVANGVAITADYEYDSEMNTNIPQVDMILSSSPVQAKPKKLRTRWGMEAEQDLKSVHGLEAEVELTAAITAEIKFEIDLEVVADLSNAAYAALTTEIPQWSKTPAAGVPWVLHKNSLKDIFIQASSLIFRRSGRATGNWLVAGDNVTDVVESMDGFVSANPAIVRGVHKIGTLGNRWDVFKDPTVGLNDWMVGYKGPSFLETGYVYAPYIPVYSTPLVQLDDFINRKGIATRYGKKLVNSKFYVKGSIVGTP
jgi:hypothetical protein